MITHCLFVIYFCAATKKKQQGGVNTASVPLAGETGYMTGMVAVHGW